MFDAGAIPDANLKSDDTSVPGRVVFGRPPAQTTAKYPALRCDSLPATSFGKGVSPFRLADRGREPRPLTRWFIAPAGDAER